MMGYVSGVFGTRGWLKIHSYTRPRDNLIEYPRWLIGTPGNWREFVVAEGKPRGPTLVVSLRGVATREQAESLIHAQIAVPRAALPAPAGDEYYWADLIGMQVVNRDGADLGRVVRLVEAGDHDVLVSRAAREYLIPFVRDRYVLAVEQSAGRILVDWHIDD